MTTLAAVAGAGSDPIQYLRSHQHLIIEQASNPVSTNVGKSKFVSLKRYISCFWRSYVCGVTRVLNPNHLWGRTQESLELGIHSLLLDLRSIDIGGAQEKEGHFHNKTFLRA